MIDLHCHILSGIDDGPERLGGSLELARRAVNEGIAVTAATPHVNSRFQLLAAELETLPERVADLNRELESNGVPLKVVKGAEVSLPRLDSLDRLQLDWLCLGEGHCLLVESPYTSPVPFIDEQLFRLQAQGIQPLLAHPERSPAFQRAPERVERLVRAGALCSVNAGSLHGAFGRTVRRFAFDLLRDGLVHVVASDAHDHEQRPPSLLPALEEAGSELPGISTEIERLTRVAPAAILSGDPVPQAPKLEGRPAGRLGGLLRRY